MGGQEKQANPLLDHGLGVPGVSASDTQESLCLRNKAEGESQHSRLFPDLHTHAVAHEQTHTRRNIIVLKFYISISLAPSSFIRLEDLPLTLFCGSMRFFAWGI